MILLGLYVFGEHVASMALEDQALMCTGETNFAGFENLCAPGKPWGGGKSFPGRS